MSDKGGSTCCGSSGKEGLILSENKSRKTSWRRGYLPWRLKNWKGFSGGDGKESKEGGGKGRHR